MPIINLKQQYPHLYNEIMLEVSEPIFEVYDLSARARTTLTVGGGIIMRITRWMQATESKTPQFCVRHRRKKSSCERSPSSSFGRR